MNKAPVENLIFSELEIYPGYTSTGVGKYLGLRYQKPTSSVKMKKMEQWGGGGVNKHAMAKTLNKKVSSPIFQFISNHRVSSTLCFKHNPPNSV